MKKRKFNLRNFLSRLFVGVLVVLLIVILPTAGSGTDGNLALIYNVFVGEKSKYQGIIEVWNVESFENGITSKTKLLNSIASDFQKKFKGVYVLVRNLTENECVNMLASGQCPDIFSCSYGVSTEIMDYIMPVAEENVNLYQNFLNAGRNDAGQLMGVAWCAGSYFLISTKANLEKAKVETLDEVNLLEIALKSGYQIEGKKKVTTVYSLGFGMGSYLVPQNAIATYTDSGELSISDYSLNSDNLKQSSYSAYCRFVASENVVLLGTQRDVCRMENKVSQGKVSDVIYQPLMKYTDLVQFAFMAKSDDKTKNEYKQKFVEWLTGEKAQQKVINSQMYAVSKIDYSSCLTSAMQDIILENIGNYSLNNVFVSKEEIGKLQGKINLY